MSWETAVIIGHLGITAVWFYLSINMNEEHFFIKMLFFFLGFVSMWSLLSQIYQVANAQASPATKVLALTRTELYISTLVFFAVFIYFAIWFVIKWWKKEIGPYMKPINSIGLKIPR